MDGYKVYGLNQVHKTLEGAKRQRNQIRGLYGEEPKIVKVTNGIVGFDPVED